MSTQELSAQALESMGHESVLDEYTQKRLLEEESQLEKEHEIQIKNLKKNTAIYGGTGVVIFLLILLAYSVPQFFVLQNTLEEIEQLNSEIQTNQELKTEKKETLQIVEAKKIIVEKEFGDIIPKVLPEIHSEEEFQSRINSLATFFEDLALEYNDVDDPLNIPSVDFGRPKEQDGVFVVPIKMSIEAGKKNFNLFIKAIDSQSGSVNEEDFYWSTYSKSKEPIPVMTIDSLTLSFPQEKRSVTTLLSSTSRKKTKDVYTFTVSISSYFQATDEMAELYGTAKTVKK